MIILAIDPGFDKVGFALFEKKINGTISTNYLVSGTIRTDKLDLHEKRLEKVYNSLEELVKKYQPELIVIEQIFFFKNAKTVIKVSQAQGVMLLLAAQKNITVKFLTPLQIKQIITGYGTADKKSVQKMLELQLKKTFANIEDDESDAIACGLAYCYLNEQLLQTNI